MIPTRDVAAKCVDGVATGGVVDQLQIAVEIAHGETTPLKAEGQLIERQAKVDGTGADNRTGCAVGKLRRRADIAHIFAAHARAGCRAGHC